MIVVNRIAANVVTQIHNGNVAQWCILSKPYPVRKITIIEHWKLLFYVVLQVHAQWCVLKETFPVILIYRWWFSPVIVQNTQCCLLIEICLPKKLNYFWWSLLKNEVPELHNSAFICLESLQFYLISSSPHQIKVISYLTQSIPITL